MVFLFLSMLASVAVWTYLFNFKLAVVLITSIFIHEYGHFYWMGKEGIKDKDMFFMPPFGAVARAKESWTSYGAELRIALAGPVAGLLSVILFYGLWLIYPNDIFLASVALACMINLFNLALPVAILDGGRVIKSVLYSIHRTLGDSFYLVGFFLLYFVFMYGYLSLTLVVLIGYFLYQEWSYVHHLRNRLEKLKEERQLLGKDTFRTIGPDSESTIKEADTNISKLDAVVNMKKMNRKEIVTGLLVFAVVIFTYSAIWYWVSGHIDPFKFQTYF